MSESVEYRGTKRDVKLSPADLKALQSGKPVALCIGEWDDGTPALVRVTPPSPLA